MREVKQAKLKRIINKMEKLTEEYKKFLEGLKPIGIEDFINKIKTFKESKGGYFRVIEEYLNQVIPTEILNIFQKEDFIKLFYLDRQAKYITDNINLSQDLELFKTLVYCYNSNSREFNKRIKEEKLKKELADRGFKEQDISNKEELKSLSGLKVICVFDRDKIGVLGSYTQKEEHEGKLIFDIKQDRLFFLPKRHTRTGQILTSKFYYKLK